MVVGFQERDSWRAQAEVLGRHIRATLKIDRVTSAAILLVKASHKASPDQEERKWTSLLGRGGSIHVHGREIDGGYHWRLAHVLYPCSVIITIYIGPYCQVKVIDRRSTFGAGIIVFLMLLIGPGIMPGEGQKPTIVE